MKYLQSFFFCASTLVEMFRYKNVTYQGIRVHETEGSSKSVI